MNVLWLLLLTTLAPHDGSGIEWRTDLAAATKEAARTGKPLFLVFRCVP